MKRKRVAMASMYCSAARQAGYVSDAALDVNHATLWRLLTRSVLENVAFLTRVVKVRVERTHQVSVLWVRRRAIGRR